MFDMSGKVAIVTGATQGLGAAISRELATRHAAGLVITGRSKERGEAVATRITSETGTRTVFVQADVQDVGVLPGHCGGGGPRVRPCRYIGELCR